VGYPGSDAYVDALVTGGLEEAVFVDSTDPSESCIAAYSARTYDVFIIDRLGRLAGHFNVGTNNLYDEANRLHLYYLVLEILGDF
jgi:hypothetical protein